MSKKYRNPIEFFFFNRYPLSVPTDLDFFLGPRRTGGPQPRIVGDKAPRRSGRLRGGSSPWARQIAGRKLPVGQAGCWEEPPRGQGRLRGGSSPWVTHPAWTLQNPPPPTPTSPPPLPPLGRISEHVKLQTERFAGETRYISFEWPLHDLRRGHTMQWRT